MVRAYRSRFREYAFLALAGLVGLAGWAVLLSVGMRLPAYERIGDWALFVLLTLLIKGLGGQAVRRETHSLVGILDVAALLLFGPAGGTWVVAVGSFLYQIERGAIEVWRTRREGHEVRLAVLLGNVLFDSGLTIFMALAGLGVYGLAGGQMPVHIPLDVVEFGPALVLFGTWFVLDHVGWAGAEAVLGGWAAVREWFLAVIGPSVLMELLPLPFSLLVVLSYRENLPTFVLVVGGLIGTSIVIQRLFATAHEQRRSARELAMLNEAARAIGQAELNVAGLCELIYEQSSRIVDTSIFHLGLLDGDRYTLQLRVVEGVRQDPLTVTLLPGEGIVGWMRQSKQPLLVRDFQREMDSLPARPRYISANPPRSAIFVPLLARGEMIGSLSIQNLRPAVYTEQHLRILAFIANQAAVAIEKARLYEAARERAVELERIAQDNAALYAQVRHERDRLEILFNVSRDLTSRLDLNDLLRRLLQRAVESLRAEDGTIVLLGTRRDPPRAIDSQGARDTDLDPVLEKGLGGWVVEHRLSTLVSNVHEDERWLPTGREVGSALAVPILHGENVWGVITLTHPQVGFFSEADLNMLLAMAEQAAVGLESSRLYEAQRRRAVQLQTIADVMRSILSILEIDPLLEQVVHLVRERFGYTHVHILTLDATGDEVLFRASTDPDSPFWKSRNGRLPIEEGLVGWVASHGEPVIADDVSQDPRWLPDQVDVRSEVAVPLKVGGETVGVLDVQSGEAAAFDEEDLFILRTLADQIAVALESARLYAAQQEEAWVLNALLQVAQNIAQARDLDELLEVVVRLVPLLVGVEHCVIFLRDRKGGDFRALHGYGVPREELADLRFDEGTMPAFDQAVAEARPIVLVGEEGLQALPPGLLEQMGAGAMWLFPLLAGGEVSGMLVLGMERLLTILSSRQHTILAGITNQAGVAIEEARMRRADAERQRLEQELAVAREIQRSLLPLSAPQPLGWSIEVAWQSARLVGGDFYDFIPLPDKHLGVVIADVSDKGVPAALFMVLSRSLVRASALSHHSPAEALRRANRLLLADNRAEMFVTVFYGVIDLATGVMHYASAGHNPPILCRVGVDDSTTLQAHGIVLGVVKDATLEEHSVQLEAGDTLVLYTDGVTEAIDEHEEQFGEERLQRAVCLHKGKTLSALRQALLDAVAEFTAGQPPFDDLTLVLVRREEAGGKGQEAEGEG
jgi:serine phosphatase RsbU (regulator of sigma subunit)/signal transduction protein with GAF and PtsI domain